MYPRRYPERVWLPLSTSSALSICGVILTCMVTLLVTPVAGGRPMPPLSVRTKPFGTYIIPQFGTYEMRLDPTHP